MRRVRADQHLFSRCCSGASKQNNFAAVLLKYKPVVHRQFGLRRAAPTSRRSKLVASVSASVEHLDLVLCCFQPYAAPVAAIRVWNIVPQWPRPMDSDG